MIDQMNQQSHEFLHSWYLLIMTFFSLLFLFLNQNYVLNSPIIVICFYCYFKNGLTFSKLIRLIGYSLFFSLGIFILNVLYPQKELRSGEVIKFFNMVFYETSILKAQKTMIRMFFVSLLSMSASFAIDYSKVVLHLMVHKGLKLFWGYPMLLAMNSVALFREEFDRIKINARFRNLPLKDQFLVFFPLLVFSIRHSQRGALSLVTRGLNHRKNFYFSYEISKRDKTFLLFFWSIYLMLMFFTLNK